MNHSRGAISAETVASTNEPLIMTMDHNYQQQQQHHATTKLHHRLHNPHQLHSPASATTTSTAAAAAAAQFHNDPSSIVDYFTKSIHQQLNPSTSSLPSLLARSLVANFNDGNDQQQQLEEQQQQQATTTTITATDIDQQRFNNNNNNNNNYNYDYEQQQSFSDWWTDYWSRQPFPSGYTQSSITLLACLITTIIFLIVVGNLLVVVAIFTEKSLKPTQNWFIASLAVSDMLLGLVVMPFSLARELMGFWIFGPLWCDIHEAIDVLLTTASINTLCLISLDRYWSITQAVNYLKKRTPKRGAFMIAFVWIFSAAVSLPPLFGWKKQSPTIIANITTVSPSSSSSNKHHKHHHHHQQHLNNNRSSSTTTTTTQPPTTTTISEFLALDRRRHATSGQLRPLDRRRRRGELATPIIAIGRGGANDHGQFSGSRLMSASAPESPSNPSLILKTDAEAADLTAASRSRLQRDLNSNNNNNPNTIDLSAGGSSYTPSANQQQQQPQVTNQVTEYPSCQLSDDIGYVLYSALGSFYIPCAVMVFTYIKIFLAARSRARRAINKQSRGTSGAAANKRLANRRSPNPPAAPQAGTGNTKLPIETSGNSNPITSCNSVAVSQTTGMSQMNHHHENGQQQQQQPPITKGKIVIFERKKSLAAAAGFPTTMPNKQQQNNGSDHPHGSPQNDMVQPSANNQHHHHQMNRATYTCSDLMNRSSSSAAAAAAGSESGGKQQLSNNRGIDSEPEIGGGSEIVEMMPASDSSIIRDGCTLTTSGAKQASPSALNGGDRSLSQESSMITVMNASMAEVPVTRFNFKPQQPVQAESLQQSGGKDSSLEQQTTNHHHHLPGENTVDAADTDTESRKAAALLEALSRAGKEDRDQLLMRKVWSADNECEMNDRNRKQTNECCNSMQGIVSSAGCNATNVTSTNYKSDRSVGEEDEEEEEEEVREGEQIGDLEAASQLPNQVNTTNETCFMTIEEDSDMFDAQTGRTIMMIAGNASQKQAKNLTKLQGGIMMTMLPPTTLASSTEQPSRHHHQAVICNNVVCMRSHHQPAIQTRSGSSYCGSSMTINDDDIDDCVDDELLTDDCNGFSVSCNLDQYCTGVSSCPQCQECNKQQQSREQGQQQQQQQQEDRQRGNSLDNSNISGGNRHLSISDSPGRKRQLGIKLPLQQMKQPTAAPSQQQQQQPPHHHHHHLHQLTHQQHHNRRLSEAHSLTGDDNLSLNEYRSNEDSSSIMGHDVLDATEVHRSDKKRPASSGGSSQTPIVGGRKKSSIGFRLARLGSTAPLTVHSSGLLALASSQQQQQQNQAAGGASGGGGGTRNLKALRQNFFMKLNQLTAKAAAKQQEHKSKKLSETSPTGKSSAQSSGTSYEQSVDCATTSNVQSADYQPEMTAGTMDESEQQTSGEPQSSLTSKGAGELRGGQRDQRGSYSGSSGANSSSGKQTTNKQGDSSEYEAGATKMAANLKPRDASASANANNNNNGKSSPASKKTASANNESNNNNNQTTIDKNDDRALLLLRDPSQQEQQQAGQDGNKQRGSSTLTTSGGGGGGGQNGKSSQVSKVSNNKEANGRDQTSQQLQRTKGQLNHNSALPSSQGGQTGSGTNRAYLASDNERHKRKLAKARERRATLILGLIMAAFICSWMPFFTFYVLRALCTVCRDFISPRFEAFIFWMGYCNSAINPIIYTIFNRDFRKAFRKILFKCL